MILLPAILSFAASSPLAQVQPPQFRLPHYPTPITRTYPINSTQVPPAVFTPPKSVKVGATAEEGWNFAIQDHVLADADGDLNTTDDQVVLNGNIFLNPFDINLTLGGATQIELSNTARMGLDVDVIGTYTETVSDLISIASVPLTVIPITDSLYVEPYLLLYLTLEGSVEGGFKVAMQREAQWDMGVTYDYGVFETYSDFPDLAEQPSSPQVSGNLGLNLSAAGYLATAYVPVLSGVPLVGPIISGKAELGLDVMPLQAPWWQLTGGFSAVSGWFDPYTGPSVGATLWGPNTTVLKHAQITNTGSGTGSNTRWAKVYEFNAGVSPQGGVSATDGSGDQLIVASKGLSDGYLMQIAEDGSTTWALETNRLIDDVAATPDGDYYLAVNGSTSGGGIIMKIDNSGSLIWEKALNGEIIELIGMEATADGGAVGVGTVWENGEDYIGAVKLDQDGKLLWARKYGDSYHEGARNVFELSGGDLMIAGSGAYEDAASSVKFSNAVAMRLDADGHVQWTRAIGTPGIDKINNATMTPSGMIMVGQVSGEENVAWACSVSTGGSLLWSRVYAGEERGATGSSRTGGDTPWDELNGIVALGEFNGGTLGQDGYVILGDTSIGADQDAWAIRLGELNGDKLMQWFRAFRGIDEDAFRIGLETSDGVMLIGHTQSWPATGGSNRMLIVHSTFEGGGRTDRDLGGNDIWEVAQSNHTVNVVSVDPSVIDSIVGLVAEDPLNPTVFTTVTPTETWIHE